MNYYKPTQVYQIVTEIKRRTGYTSGGHYCSGVHVYYYIHGTKQGKISLAGKHKRQEKKSALSRNRELVGTYSNRIKASDLRDDIKFIVGGGSNETIAKPDLPVGVHGGTCYGRSGYISI